MQLSGISKINSIFFGGGTPSLALPSTVGRVIDMVKHHVTFPEGSEVTLEANPTQLETSRLKDFKSAGVNRLSIGVQALNEEDLKFLGRDHSVTEAERCIEEAQKMFPGHVSVDLMFGRPGQTLEAWVDELAQVIRFGVNHLSLYQLTVERGTQLFRWVQNGDISLPDNDEMADMYSSAVKILEAHGLERYEVSNFARRGYESKHNQAYWSGSQYIGVGPGAHGRFAPQEFSKCQEEPVLREARIQTLEPENWMYEVEKFGHATRKIVPLAIKDRLEELLCLGLRTRQGITSEIWSSTTTNCQLTVFKNSERCKRFFDEQLLILDERGLRATGDGLLILDSIIPHLLLALEETYHFSGIT